MYKCSCGTIVRDDNAYSYLDNVTQDNPVTRIAIVCPSCGKRTVTGGELSYDPEWGHCIMTFGENYDPNKHADIPKVAGIRSFEGLTATDGKWAIVGHHKNLGSGILGWYQKEWEAKIEKGNLQTSDKNAELSVITKKSALQTHCS